MLVLTLGLAAISFAVKSVQLEEAVAYGVVEGVRRRQGTGGREEEQWRGGAS